MERNQIIGLVVMLVFITVYFQFFAPEPPEPAVQATTQNQPSADSAQTAAVSQEPTLSDSARAKLAEMRYGVFSTAAEGQESTTTLENDQVIIRLSNKGAVVSEVILKEFQDFEGQPLKLVDKKHTSQSLIIKHLTKDINLSDLYFDAGGVKKSSDGNSQVLTYTLKLNESSSLTYIYTLPADSYELALNIKQTGLGQIIEAPVAFSWNQKMNRVEKDFKDARNRSTVIYRYADGEVDELDGRSTEKEEEILETPANWVSFRQKFFTTAVIARTPFSKGSVSSVIDFNDSSSIKHVSMDLTLPAGSLIQNPVDFTYFFGPNNYAILKKVTPDFEENVELGWSVLAWINKFAIIPIFHFLENYVSNYGIIIIIMVIILKLVLSPLTYTSHMGMAKMRVLKPELDEIKEKHGDDMQKAQQEQMALYQKVGINPLSGCIPMVLQMPILFAMFYFFPNSIELRQEGFLWATDLSTFDSIWDMPFTIPFYGDHVSLFTLLMTVSTILYTWSNSQMTASVQGPMKTLQYVMPIMFLFFLNSYSAGLTFYYFVSNIVSFGQMALFRKLIDEDKIKTALEENRKKNASKKKSSFQQRLEDAMKAQDQKKKSSKKK